MNVIASEHTMFDTAMHMPDPHLACSREVTDAARMPPAAPVRRNTPNRASGIPSLAIRYSTRLAEATDRLMPKNVLRNQSLRSIRLAMMK